MDTKTKKIIIINIIAVVGIVCIAEICSYFVLLNKYKDDIISFLKISEGKEIKIPYLKYVKVELPDKKDLLKDFRPVEYRNKDKRPIILFGDSYTYGFGLEENETFSRKLADYTDRTVVNRGKSGTGIPFLYYQLSNNDVIKELPDNPEYIIFTLIPDHFPRLFRYRNWVMAGDHTLRYKIKNDRLEEDKLLFPFIHSLFTSIILEEYIAEKKNSNAKTRDELFYKLVNESYSLIKKHFPPPPHTQSENTKIVIIYYECILDRPDAFKTEIEALKNISDDIIIFNIKEEIPYLFKDKKYWLEDDSHPSAEAWDVIIPKLAEKLNLNN